MNAVLAVILGANNAMGANKKGTKGPVVSLVQQQVEVVVGLIEAEILPNSSRRDA